MIIDQECAGDRVRDGLGPPAQVAAAAEAGKCDLPVSYRDGDPERGHTRRYVIDEGRADFCFYELVSERGLNCPIGTASATFGKVSDGFDTGLDRQPLGIDHHMVEACVLPLDVEKYGHCAGPGGVVALDLMPHRVGVLGSESVHKRSHAEVHGCTHPHTNDLRYIAQQRGGTPAFDQDVAFLSQAQNFLARIVDELATIDPLPLEKRRRAIHVTQECLCVDAEPFGDAIGDHL